MNKEEAQHLNQALGHFFYAVGCFNLSDVKSANNAVEEAKKELAILEGMQTPSNDDGKTDLRFFKSQVSRIMEEWKGGENQENIPGEKLAMEWIAQRIYDHYKVIVR